MAPALLKSSPQRLSPLIPQRFKSARCGGRRHPFKKNFTNGRGTSSCGAALASALLKPSYSTVYFHPVLDDSDSPRSSSPCPLPIKQRLQARCRINTSITPTVDGATPGEVFKLYQESSVASSSTKWAAGAHSASTKVLLALRLATGVPGSLPDPTRALFGAVPPYYAVWTCRAVISLSPLARLRVPAQVQVVQAQI
ncbi:hypothetical protein R3P38DRAFT_3378774 [Favolaschia claudopus]|uniref:Uncharacterized protein n=1 Tax=Favolaschia claudopus TaxID=2862362 RepID=A0AAV9Z6K6_9AGAR